ncbi:unnamed protein product [Schistosoma mattheei]|uniref:Uncharacterized protein n=1 Tax=Schistosoma mattheei TaxID=31246 RepID=A0A3P8HA85_9TREM|nr:unnamed protein product [Schistosoma mattheei]
MYNRTTGLRHLYYLIQQPTRTIIVQQFLKINLKQRVLEEE